MGLGHSPQIITNGMVLCLDAANPKNYNLTEVEVLVVAGGGGGAADVGGAGGAGGLVYNRNFAVTPGSALTVTVGGGGAGRAPVDTSAGGNGGNSVFGSITATGGGGGGGYNSNPGNTGGSGGGGGGVSGTGGAGTSGQGFAGGSGNGQSYQSGGGGGAGEAGKTGSGIVGGNGGNGLEFPQFASVGGSPAGWFAGGGGGGGGNDSGSDGRGYGGLGGGGTGASRSGTYATNSSFRDAVANTGGGGGGTGGWNTAGNGGSGIVIVRYPGPQKAIGGTVTSVNGDTIHTFTTVGSTTFTPLVATNNSTILGLSDFSGNSKFSTTSNSPTYSSANGGSISFDGTDDFSTSGALSGSFTSFTVIIWFYPTSVSNYENPIDCNYSYNGTTGNIGPRLEMNDSGTLGWLYSDVTSSNASYYYHPVVSSGLVANTWHCAAITYNGGTNTSTTYYNGNATGLSRTSNGSPTGFVGVMNNVTIGKGFHLGGAERIFTGRVSNTTIYNRALTASEISQNFQALRGRFGI